MRCDFCGLDVNTEEHDEVIKDTTKRLDQLEFLRFLDANSDDYALIELYKETLIEKP
jgi:hypothetical protein